MFEGDWPGERRKAVAGTLQRLLLRRGPQVRCVNRVTCDAGGVNGSGVVRPRDQSAKRGYDGLDALRELLGVVVLVAVQHVDDHQRGFA